MNLKALIARFRVLANDKAEPYFWSDEEVSGWLNDAVHEACLRGRLLHSDDAFVTDVEKGRPLYAYAAGGFAAGYAYEIDSIRFVSDGKPVCLKLVSPEAADVCAPGWRDGAQTGLPVYAVQGDGKLTLAPAPDRDGRLFAGGIACRGIWRGTGTSRKSIPYIIGIWFIGLWRRLSVSRMRRLSTRSVRNRQGGVSSCISACRPTVICAVSRVRIRRT